MIRSLDRRLPYLEDDAMHRGVKGMKPVACADRAPASFKLTL